MEVSAQANLPTRLTDPHDSRLTHTTAVTAQSGFEALGMGLEGLLSKDKAGDVGDIANPKPTEGAVVSGAEPLGLVLGQVSATCTTTTTPHPAPRHYTPHHTSPRLASPHSMSTHHTPPRLASPRHVTHRLATTRHDSPHLTFFTHAGVRTTTAISDLGAACRVGRIYSARSALGGNIQVIPFSC